MKVNQFVTGHDAAGNAIFLSENQVSPVKISLLPGYKTFELWSTSGTPVVPYAPETPYAEQYFPKLGESIFRVIEFPPQQSEQTSYNFSEEAVAELKQKLPGAIEHLEPTNPGMHTTDSVDYGLVLKGEIVLELDNGEQRVLTAGDCVVQNGTRHAWINRTQQPALMAFVLLGAKRIIDRG